MEIASLTPAIQELERAIAWAATPTGIPAGHRIVATIQSNGRRRTTCGWFMRNIWSTREGDLCHEINFAAEWLRRSVEEIIETAIHEVVHLWCHSQEIKDCSSSGRHNREFKRHAELLGLVCAQPTGWRGYAYTSASPELLARMAGDLRPDVAKFALFRLMEPSGHSPTKMLKWSCGCTNVRCATQLEATCDRCGNVFDVEV